MKPIKWNRVPFNPYLQGLDPRMLQDGLILSKDIKKHDIGRISIEFDRSFVIRLIVKKIIRPLMISRIQDWQKLSAEAWRVYKNGEAEDTESNFLVSPQNGEKISHQAEP